MSGATGKGSGGERMYSAARTSLGKMPNSKLILLGTRAATGGHFLSRLISRPSAGEAVQVHAADPDGDPFNQHQWHRANPGLRFGLPMKSVLVQEAARARTDPAAMQMFRSLRLNLGEPDHSLGELVVEAATWKQCLDRQAQPEGPLVVGLDLGGARSLTSAAAYWPQSGRLDSMSACGGTPPLLDRGETDGVGGLYLQAQAAGELSVAEGWRLPDVGVLVERVLEAWGRPAAVYADNYHQAEAADILDRYGIELTVRRGLSEQVEDLARFRRAADIRLSVRPGRALLSHAMAVARTRTLTAGDRVLAPGRLEGMRDDPAAAAILAVGRGEALPTASPPAWSSFNPFAPAAGRRRTPVSA